MNVKLPSALSKRTIIILAAAIVVIVAVLVVLLLVLPVLQGGKPPQFTSTVETSGKTLYIYHDGGDTLQKDKTAVFINGEPVPIGSISFLNGQDWPWIPGKTMKAVYSGVGSPLLVEVRYSVGGKLVTIFSRDITPPPETPPPATTAPVNVSQAATGALTPVPTLIEVIPGQVPVTPQATHAAVTAAQVQTAASSSRVVEPPVALFTAQPPSGQVPLTVHFTDQSTGRPDEWLWSFGDGESSGSQNPVHTYSHAGMYTVSLTVSNLYGVNTKTAEGLLSVGMSPEATFTASTRSGMAPLTIRFTDISSGSPGAWLWDFGDGQTSREQNPSHIYPDAGTYSVTLTTSNQYGSDTRLQAGYITVNSPEVLDIYIKNGETGHLSAGGYLQFRVTGNGAWIKMNGSIRNLEKGSLVQIFADSLDKGQIDIQKGRISYFTFDQARLFVDGMAREKGIISSISIPESDSIASTLIFTIAGSDKNAQVMINGRRLPDRGGQSLRISGIRPNADGNALLTFQEGYISARTGAERFELF